MEITVIYYVCTQRGMGFTQQMHTYTLSIEQITQLMKTKKIGENGGNLHSWWRWLHFKRYHIFTERNLIVTTQIKQTHEFLHVDSEKMVNKKQERLSEALKYSHVLLKS